MRRCDIQYAPEPAPFFIRDSMQMSKLAFIPHRHRFYVILWVFHGRGKHVIDGHAYDILPNSLFFIAPNQVHRLMGDANPAGFLILFTVDFLGPEEPRGGLLKSLDLFNSEVSQAPLMLAPRSVKPLMTYAHGMMDAYHSGDLYRFETIGAYLRLFLIECRRQSVLKPEGGLGAYSGSQRLVRAFRVMVEKRSRQWHQVQSYARELHVSAKHLGETVHAELNQAPKDYIQDRILMEAKRLLLFTDRSLKEISFDLGFPDPTGFSRFFKKITGGSVQSFRQRSASR
jgi:AraC family transcriptional regulator, transcriptional activator of pobA